jgi:hypothetical protein
MVGAAVGKEASVGALRVSVGGGGGVAVKTAEVGTSGEQETRKKIRRTRRVRDVVRGGMGVFYRLSPFNEKPSRRVPLRKGGR